ncbi:PAS domain S-box protein [Bdellovibrio sp. HCB185ZH]|uniref:PAS domain S-box protein n=1 Tax=Bdellovibrio sp. HCB185ZH TaxID=3394235 RepID=UPI0039A581F7
MSKTDSYLINRVYEDHDVAAYLSDHAGNIHVWNKPAEKLLGYSEKEIGKRSERDLFWDKTELISDGGIRYTWRQCKNKNLLFVKESVVEISDPSGQGDQFLKLIEDWTHEVAPWEQCSLWISQYSASHHGVFVANARNGNFLLLNQFFVGMVKGDPQTILRSSAKDYLVKEKRLKACPSFVDGKLFPAEIDVLTVADDKGKPLYYLAHVHPVDADIKKFSEEELALLYSDGDDAALLAKCAQWFKPYENAQISAHVTDARKNTFVMVNKFFAEHLGYAVEELINSTTAKLMPRSFEFNPRQFATLLETHGWCEVVTEIRDHAGKSLYIRSTAIAIYDDQDKMRYRCVVNQFVDPKDIPLGKTNLQPLP